jgi:uncharacterized protein (TIGR02466 family)
LARAERLTSLQGLFATDLYRASLAGETGFVAFNAELTRACRALAAEDRAGQAWSRQHGYGGYTSYASLNDLPTRATVFGELKRRLDRHAALAAKAVAFDLGPRGRLRLDSLWVNVLKGGAAHSGHIHPHAVLSGTVYVVVPRGAGAIRFEDPRLPLMMAAPPRRADAPPSAQRFVAVEPAVGDVLIWESWLRHEVLVGGAKSPRISLSFNYAWA